MKRNHYGPLTMVVAAAITLGGLAGCGSGNTDADEPVPALTTAERELLRQASERLVSHCMNAHGFTYLEEPPPGEDRVFRYVLDDVAWAHQHGYGPLIDRRGPAVRDVNDATLEDLPPARQRAWHRTLMGAGKQLTVELPDAGRLSAPDNGCLAEARRTLYGDLEGWYRARRTVDHIDGYVAGQVTDSVEYRTALSAWAGCVQRRGHRASTPDELRRLVAAEQPGPATAPEITAAVAESECAVTTGFSGTASALDRRYRQQNERRFAHEINALNQYERTALPKARKLVAEG